MWRLLSDLIHVRQMRAEITDLTNERNHLLTDRSRLIGQLFEGDE